MAASPPVKNALQGEEAQTFDLGLLGEQEEEAHTREQEEEEEAHSGVREEPRCPAHSRQ